MYKRKSQTKRGRAQDRRLVSGKQKHEVAHVQRVSGKSKQLVIEAIKSVGHSRMNVMQKLEELRDLLNMILPPKTKGAKKKK